VARSRVDGNPVVKDLRKPSKHLKRCSSDPCVSCLGIMPFVSVAEIFSAAKKFSISSSDCKTNASK
jgi:hypothetical protein